MRTKKIAPIHPGEILLGEFLKPLGISQYKLAKDISVPARRINEIVHGKRSISGRYSSKIIPLFQPVRAVLVKPSGKIRSRSAKGQPQWPNRS